MIETFVEEQGIYYLILAFCAIGVIGKMYESIIYHKLLKAVENPERTEHPFLKQLKLKYKSYYRLERKIHNTDAFIETNLFRYRHHFVGLEGIRTVNTRIMLLCILASCVGIGCSIYFEMDKWEMMYYILAGTLSTAGLELIDQQCGIDSKRRFLFTSLKDYVENILANQMEGTEKAVPEKDLAGTQAQELEERTKNAGKQVAVSKAPDKKGKAKAVNEGNDVPEKSEETIAQEKVIAEVIKEFFP